MDRRRTEPAPKPLLSLRAAVILLFGAVGAVAAGCLSAFAGASWAQAALTGAGAFLALVTFLNAIIG
ncbi:hypothetical protein [Streptomyces spongiae]|uniref:Uncharacterized protein n=1 Tax=Streptomyces spongiae TaxID=565072 RepID=A0A5N8XX92_9ACTN|nr:hypothetical protein [Streptomyces spongiae]MPY63335.1 hypothetical protein [Streptomyces spongiae]